MEQPNFKNPILTADTLYQWTKKNVTETSVLFSPIKNIMTFLLKYFKVDSHLQIWCRAQKYHFISLISFSGLTFMLKKYLSSS